MTESATAEGNTSATTDEPTPTDRPLPCVDVALEFASDALLADFDAWCAARDCTTATLRRQTEANA